MIAGKERLARAGLTRLACRIALLSALLSLAAASAAGASTVSRYAYGHAYRHGVVPTRGAFSQLPAFATSINNLGYGGGITIGGVRVGVTTGQPKVYLVFYGSQWGTQGTNSAGNVTFSGDPAGFAPYVEAFLKGLGTGNELWSGVMTQYCQGVTAGTQTCPASNTHHVGYPTGGAFAGVWADETVASPSAATAHQLALEAVKAANHFGFTTQASNRNVQYVIVSPHGTDPDGYQNPLTGFCAWHDYTGDTSLGTVSPTYIAFTNLPYLTDVGASCGKNFVNAGTAGNLDGVSIVEGHEYAETITDQFPAGGWTVRSSSSKFAGEENGDLCAWISSGSGRSQDITLTTGTFAVQTTWANDGNSGAGACEVSHPIITNPSGNTITVTNPGSQTSTVGTAVSLQINATDSASGQTLTYSATGLPAGLSINSSTGLISGTPTTAQTTSATVTVKDTTGASGSATFSWTVNGSSGCTAGQLLGNPGFETGTASPWTVTRAAVIEPASAGETPNSGTYDAWLGYQATSTTKDVMTQQVSVPAGCTNYTYSYWLHIDSSDPGTTASATLKASIYSSSGTLLQLLDTFTNLNAATGYVQHSYNLAAYAGQTIVVRFGAQQTSSLLTNFVIDDTALNVS